MKKIIPLLLLATAAIVAVPATAQAKKSHICTTSDASTRFIKDQTLFVCTEMEGKITYLGLIKKGYRVISITVHNYLNDGYGYTDWGIVIEK